MFQENELLSCNEERNSIVKITNTVSFALFMGSITELCIIISSNYMDFRSRLIVEGVRLALILWPSLDCSFSKGKDPVLRSTPPFDEEGSGRRKDNEEAQLEESLLNDLAPMLENRSNSNSCAYFSLLITSACRFSLHEFLSIFVIRKIVGSKCEPRVFIVAFS